MYVTANSISSSSATPHPSGRTVVHQDEDDAYYFAIWRSERAGDGERRGPGINQSRMKSEWGLLLLDFG